MTLANEQTNDSVTTIKEDTITHFIDDHNEQLNKPDMMTHNDIPKQMDDVHTIVEFLKRPVLLDQIVIKTNPIPLSNGIGTKQTPVWNKTFPSSLVQIESKLRKLENFAYLKANIKIKLTINANPFVSGKLLLVYSPYEDLTPAQHKMNNYPRMTISAYPNCEIDLQLDTSVEILIPFLSYKEAYNLIQKDIDYASVYLYALTNLRTPSASNPVTINVFGSFEDITLYGPTLSEVSSSYLTDKQNFLRKLKELPDYKLKQLAEIQIKSEQKDNKGIISEVASKVSGLAGSLSSVPVVGSIATDVKWVSDMVGNVASLFGFSKPTTVQENCKLSNIPGYGSTHMKTIDQGNSLALNNDYKLGDQRDVFQTNIDEMQIEYVCNNAAIRDVTSWVSGTNYFFETSVSVPFLQNGTSKTLVPFEFCAQFFQRWRATMCFKVSIAKTCFHSGRLEVYFNVGQTTPTLTNSMTTEEASNCFRAVLDITNDTELTVKIPYISNLLWLDKGDTMGYFKIRSMGDLVYNSNVSDTVDIVVHQWAENVMFVDPSTPFIYPTDTTPKVRAELQIQLVNKASPNVVIFGKMSDELELNKQALLLCGGDMVENFRPMTRIFQFYTVAKTGTKVNLKGIEEPSYINVLSHIYKMRRGGTRIKAIPINDPEQYNVLFSQLIRDNYVRTQPYHYTFPRLNPVHEINIPFYTKYRRIINNIESGPSDDETYDLPDLLFSTDRQNGDSLTLLRAGDDDFSLGWLIGIPPMSGAPNVYPVDNSSPTRIPVEISNLPDNKLNFGFDYNVRYNIDGYNDIKEKVQYHNFFIGRKVPSDSEETNRMVFGISSEPDLSGVIAKFYTVADQVVLDQPMSVLFDENDAIRTAWITITKS